MAYELRIIKGDTYEIEFDVRDSKGVAIPITETWNIAFRSDNINKTSVDNPDDFIIETGKYGAGQGIMYINSNETDISCYKDHFKFLLYKGEDPPIIKTFASGDLFFIDEA